MADIPVYLIAGFLDGGKTDFINGILADGFAREDKTLLICCEEGELEYEQKALDNVTVVTVDEETALTCSQCKEWEKQYKPKQVLIEYNGMWSMERLYREVLPANWVLYQVMTFVDANTFETYAKTKPARDGLKAQKTEKARSTYRERYESDFIIADAAARYFRAHGVSKLPSHKALQAEIEQLTAEKNAHYNEYREKKARVKELHTVKSNLSQILQGEKDREKTHEQER